jgi:hypothetical protein
MATLNVTPDTLVSAAGARGTDAEYRRAVVWSEASQTERVALHWLRKAMRGNMPPEDADRWMMMAPTALGTANDRERALIDLADCAVEVAVRDAVN